MAKTDFRSVDEYIASKPPELQRVLERVRAIVRRALPGVEEGISYQIPAYTLHGRRVLYFAGWKEHVSLYPATERLVAAFAEELAGYEISKGTIRFPLARAMPARLIAAIARFLAQESARRATAKTIRKPAPKRPRPARRSH